MPGKRSIPMPKHLRDTQPPPEPSSPTVGEILGLPPDPYLPGFAVMADSPDELKDPRLQEPPHRPGENEPPPGQRPPERSDPGDGQPVPAPTEPGDEEEPEEDGEDEVPPDGDEQPQPDTPAEIQALNDQRRSIYDRQRQRYGAPITPADEDFTPSGEVRYESRITIVDAFRYPGSLTLAPDWIDRNWVGYGDYDPVRSIEAGPCLRVPSVAFPGDVVLARIGDYVCRQSVIMSPASLSNDPFAADDVSRQRVELRIEVWPAEQFVRLFVAVPVERAVAPGPGAARTARSATSSRQRSPSTEVFSPA